MSRTFVLVHGAWHGGWCWRIVAERLRASGHRVFTPTCTGLGERAHMLSRDITLETFTNDIAGMIEAEELQDVVLVGHSFGGLPVSGVADRMPDRIRSLVFLDSRLAQPGTSPIDGLTPDAADARRREAADSSAGLSLPVPDPSVFGVFEPAAAAWLRRRMTPHPFSTFTSPLELRNPIGNGLPRTYVACTDPPYLPLESVRTWARQQAGWRWEELAAGHDAMVTAPDRLAALLERLAAD